MALPNPQYVLQQDLESIFLDKNTGLPLAGGKVHYYKDNNRNSPKTVYELSGAPPNYNYTALPNPITLSNIGTPMNAVGDNVAVYYRPWNDFDPAALETYYVVVEDALGNPQFTRENWPYPNVGAASTGMASSGAYDNELSNPQFVAVNFNPAVGLTIPVSGADVTVEIAPAWYLLITSTGVGSVTVNRTSIAGNSGDQSNPPYIMTFSSTGLVQSIKLYQRLDNNPNIWAQTILGAAGNGYIATSIMLAPGSNITMRYEPNIGTSTQLIAANNVFGTYQNFENTVQLPAGNNTATSDTGYADISIFLPVGQPTSLSSVQIIGLETNIAQVPYEQQTVNRQKALLSHYYQPKLAYKPVPSHLVGWDFPLNPAQFTGSVVAVNPAGANGAYYAWDQTIIFQTTNNGVSVSRGTNGGMVLTAAQIGQFAIIQYLDEIQTRKILNDRISVHISASTSRVGGLVGRVTLWACTDANVPVLPLSIVATLDANGAPATRTGTWTQVTRSNLGDAYINLALASATNSEDADINLNGWDMLNIVPTNTATRFAIVIGFASCAIADTVTFNSVGLCSGDIATRPAPKTTAETLLACNEYYFKTFENTVTPVQGAGGGLGYLEWGLTRAVGTDVYQIHYPVKMRVVPNIVFYNPAAASAEIRNFVTGTNYTATAATNSTTKSLTASGTPPAASAVGDIVGVHITADARLGVV